RTPPPRVQAARSGARTARESTARPLQMPGEWHGRPWRSEGLVEQRRDRGAVGVADGAAGFLVALEGDQRRLHADPEGLHGVLLLIEIDDEIHQILELRRGHQLAQDRILCLA